VGQYGYDFAGHRVWWNAGGTIPQVADTYDLEGRLQTEANVATGALYREYIWLDDQVIGMAIPGASTAVRFVTTGQIDEPLIMTTSSKTLSWNDYLDPFGVGGSITGSANELNLRYPGQWYQVESSNAGLNQNGWREYDPTLGRYTQPDPLGIDGGTNVYGYVDGDPLNVRDPWGLAVTIVIGNRTYSPTGNSVQGTINVTSDQTPGTFSGYTMENSSAGDNASKAPVPAGTYNAFLRTDHNPNRIELIGVPGYQNIQIHNGSYPRNFKGCFGVGLSHSTDFLGQTVQSINQIDNIVRMDGSGKITVIVGPLR
jgi:RHS repeat-associated protein